MRFRIRSSSSTEDSPAGDGELTEFREKVLAGRMPSKLRILRLLIRRGPMRTSEISEYFKLKRISALQHLSKLKKCRLVGRIRGRWQVTGNTSLMASQIDEALARKKENDGRSGEMVKLKQIRRKIWRSMDGLSEKQLLTVMIFVLKLWEMEK